MGRGVRVGGCRCRVSGVGRGGGGSVEKHIRPVERAHPTQESLAAGEATVLSDAAALAASYTGRL